MKWTDIPHGKIIAAELRLWEAFGDRADEIATRINTDLGFAAHLAAFALNPGFADKSITSLNEQWLRAREIMGRNFFGVEEAIQHFGITLSKRHLAALAEIPFTEEMLRSAKETHILVAVLPISILEIRAKVTADGLSLSVRDECANYDYDDELYAQDRGKASWHLVRKEPVDGSEREAWDDQQLLFDKSDQSPETRVMFYSIIGHYLVTGERLFQKIVVRCSDANAWGNRVCIGSLSNAILVHIYMGWDGKVDARVGLASEKKKS